MGSQQMEIISQTQIKIEPKWENEINIKLEGQYIKIEEKLDVTNDSCTVQYTDIETKLFSDNSFKIEEGAIHIKNETELRLKEVDNSKNFEEGGCQHCFTNDEEKYKRNICNHTYSQEGNLETRLLVHTSEKMYVCVACGKSFTHKVNLTKHFLSHSNVKKIKCNVCEKSFTRKSCLSRHELTHSGDKNFKCNICEKLFTHKCNLNLHLLIHSGDKNFKCNICEKLFTRKSHLNTHLLVHSGDKNFKCNVCEKLFTQKSHLTEHLLIHSGEKNYKCNVCEKSFTRKSHLKGHLLIHSGEKNYKCNVCEKSFTWKSDLTRHLLIHSGNKNDEINIKQLEGQYLKIEEKLDVTTYSCTDQYTDVETKLFSDSTFKVKEETHIKDEPEQCLEEVDKNSKHFEEGSCQQYFTNDEEKYNPNFCKYTCSQEGNLNLETG